MSWVSWLVKADTEAARVPDRASRWASQAEIVPVACPRLGRDVPRVSILSDTHGLTEGDAFGFMVRERKSTELTTPASGSIGEDRAISNEKIVYLLVGGAYLLEHSLSTHTIFSLANLTQGRVFSVNYRKSLLRSDAFPGSLLDALAGYQYLIEGLGFSPQNIILCGDSAGANLCLAVVRYLDELMTTTTFQRWSLPAGLFLNSPWADPSGSTPSASRARRTSLTMRLLKYAFSGVHASRFPDWQSNPYFCPALCGYALFDKLATHGVKVYISSGGNEPLLDEIELLRDEMQKRNVAVTYRKIPDGTHSEFAEYQRKEGECYAVAWRMIEEDFRSFWTSFL